MLPGKLPSKVSFHNFVQSKYVSDDTFGLYKKCKCSRCTLVSPYFLGKLYMVTKLHISYISHGKTS